MLASALCIVLSTACGSGTSQVLGPGGSEGQARLAHTLVVEPDTITTEEGDSIRFTARIVDATGSAVSGYDVRWSIGDTTIARIREDGTVITQGVGESAVDARAIPRTGGETLRDRARLWVKSGLPVASVSVSPGQVAIDVGDSRALTATLEDALGRSLDRPVTWSSSDRSVATVSSSGNQSATVQGMTAGSATIVAHSESRTDTAHVTVEEPTVASVALSPGSTSLIVGDSIELAATVVDDDGDTLSRAPTWSSTDASVASVDSHGTVTGHAEGSAGIVASVDGIADTASVSVGTASVASVSIAPGSAQIAVGDTFRLTATLRDANGNLLQRSVSWSTSNPGVATVDAGGRVSGETSGSARIVASVSGRADTATITVKSETATVASVTVTPGSVTVDVGGTGHLDATVTDAAGNTLGRNATWRSTSSGVASVDEDGTVTGEAPGSASVIATVDGLADTASVTVTSSSEPASVASVSVSPTSATLDVGASTKLDATPRDIDGNVLSRTVSWKSTNSAAASVAADGTVTGAAAGSAGIIASVDGRADTATVTIRSPSGGSTGGTSGSGDGDSGGDNSGDTSGGGGGGGGAPPASVPNLPAFPGAEGYGAVALQQVDRGDPQVLFVTNLNRSGAGSLRDAVNRIDDSRFSVIVFRVGGTIDIGQLNLGSKRNFYIAGQTAPGDGIQLYCDGCAPLIGSPRDAVIRYLRVRSDKGEPGNQDVISIGSGTQRVVFDHISAAFGNDEVFSLTANMGSTQPLEDVTVQRSIIAVGMNPHSTGSLIKGNWGGRGPLYRLSLHHNLWAHSAHRNPRIDGPRAVQLVNNVVYNWLGWGAGVTQQSNADIVGNYFKDGPWTGPSRQVLVDTTDIRVFLQSNVADPKQMDPAGDQTNLVSIPQSWGGPGRPLPHQLTASPSTDPSIPISVESPFDALNSVLNDVGANARLDCRGDLTLALDNLDRRVLDDVRNGTGPSTRQESDQPSDHGGVPSLRGGTPCTDSDSDGMPDAYEKRYSLDPDDASDARLDHDQDGYINLEEYLNATRPR